MPIREHPPPVKTKTNTYIEPQKLVDWYLCCLFLSEPFPGSMLVFGGVYLVKNRQTMRHKLTKGNESFPKRGM